MARPSKKQQFAIYQDVDAGMPTPPVDPSHEPSLDDTSPCRHSLNGDYYDAFNDEDGHHEVGSEGTMFEDIDETIEAANFLPTDSETEDARRQSAMTSTSISSLPESSFGADFECSLPMHQTYSSPVIRPPFRRPESVRRLQMSSPVSFERSPRRHIIYSRSRPGTPRAARPSVKGSPWQKRNHEELEDERRQYPLVLLHITLLPVEPRWGAKSMQEILPPDILESLQTLRSKVSETIVQRGILISHPREEYELLEERLLEALELKKERITKCGHFRARDSTSSTSSAEESVKSGDSGLGSSVKGDECSTCHCRVKSSDSGVGTDKQKWSIKVFAANGLLRASAWMAAWSEMERVDVEILPWIGEDLRRQLDARMAEEKADMRREEEEAQTLETIRHAREQQKLSDEDMIRRQRQGQWQENPIHWGDESTVEEPDLNLQGESLAAAQTTPLELPNVYQSKDIPLSLLLKNYLILLAQDKRNLLISGLGVLAFLLALRAAVRPTAINSRLFAAELDSSLAYVHDPVDISATDLLIQAPCEELQYPTGEEGSNEAVILSSTVALDVGQGLNLEQTENFPAIDKEEEPAVRTQDTIQIFEMKQDIKSNPSTVVADHVESSLPDDLDNIEQNGRTVFNSDASGDQKYAIVNQSGSSADGDDNERITTYMLYVKRRRLES